MSPYSQRYAGYLSGVDQRDGGTVQPRFQPELVNTPFGSKYVMMPTDATRNANRQRDLDASIRRVAEATGVSMAPGRDPANGMTIEQLRAMKPEERARYYRDMKAEQQANNKARYRETAYRAGGSQNINGGNRAFWNTIGNMSPDDYQATMREMMPMDPRRAMVEAQHNAMLTQLGLRVATGQGFREPTPEEVRVAKAQASAAEQQAENSKPNRTRAEEAVADGRLNDPDIEQHANELVDRLYSRVTFMGNTSDFTDNEVDLAAQRLADDLGMKFEDAKQVMRKIQEERRQNLLASSIVASIYD